jgi:hypothetical protein
MPSRIHLAPTPLEDLIGRFGGRVVCGSAGRAPAGTIVRGLSALHLPREGALLPLTRPEYLPLAREAVAAGAVLVVAERLLGRLSDMAVWVHEDPALVCAELSSEATVEDTAGPWGEGCDVAPSAIVFPRVRLGKRVRIGPNAVIGAPGFGFRAGPLGLVHVPQLGGVILEDDVWIGALSTVDSGALGPTRIRARSSTPRCTLATTPTWERTPFCALKSALLGRSWSAIRASWGGKSGWPTTCGSAKARRWPPRAGSSAIYLRTRSWQDIPRWGTPSGSEAWRQCTEWRGAPKGKPSPGRGARNDTDEPPSDHHRD